MGRTGEQQRPGQSLSARLAALEAGYPTIGQDDRGPRSATFFVLGLAGAAVMGVIALAILLYMRPPPAHAAGPSFATHVAASERGCSLGAATMGSADPLDARRPWLMLPSTGNAPASALARRVSRG